MILFGVVWFIAAKIEKKEFVAIDDAFIFSLFYCYGKSIYLRYFAPGVDMDFGCFGPKNRSLIISRRTIAFAWSSAILHINSAPIPTLSQYEVIFYSFFCHPGFYTHIVVTGCCYWKYGCHATYQRRTGYSKYQQRCIDTPRNVGPTQHHQLPGYRAAGI